LKFTSRMLRTLRKGRVWILGVLAIALCVWIVGQSDSFQSCREGERTDFENAGFHRVAQTTPSAENGDDSVESCLDYFLEQNEPGIAALSVLLTAFFTGVLAVSTIGLWKATKNLQEETKRLATIAEAQAKDMKACMAAAQKSSGIAEASRAGLQDSSARSLVPPNI
jgi:hypothetical protein